MGISLGNTDISDVKIGGTQVSSVYSGNVSVWERWKDFIFIQRRNADYNIMCSTSLNVENGGNWNSNYSGFDGEGERVRIQEFNGKLWAISVSNSRFREWWSVDGHTWYEQSGVITPEQIDTSSSEDSNPFRALSGKMYYFGLKAIYSSTDMLTWVKVLDYPNQNRDHFITDAATDGEGRFVVVGYWHTDSTYYTRTYYAFSNDSFSTITENFGGTNDRELCSVAYGDGLFLSVGYKSFYRCTTAGKWTIATTGLGVQKGWTGVSYVNKGGVGWGFVGVGVNASSSGVMSGLCCFSFSNGGTLTTLTTGMEDDDTINSGLICQGLDSNGLFDGVIIAPMPNRRSTEHKKMCKVSVNDTDSYLTFSETSVTSNIGNSVDTSYTTVGMIWRMSLVQR